MRRRTKVLLRALRLIEAGLKEKAEFHGEAKRFLKEVSEVEKHMAVRQAASNALLGLEEPVPSHRKGWSA